MVHTVELYESSKRLAEHLGYAIREENLGGVGGGTCTVQGRKCLFVDLSAHVVDRLDQIAEVLRDDPATHLANVPGELHTLLGIRS